MHPLFVRNIAASVLLTCVATGCSGRPDTEFHRKHIDKSGIAPASYMDPRADIRLNDSDIKTLSAHATTGSPEAADRLASYYLVIEHDIPETIRWWRVAATQGHVVSQFNLGTLLLEQVELASQREGAAWLEKAAGAGYDLAERALARMRENSNNP